MAIPARTTDSDGVIQALTVAQQIQVKTERLDAIRKALLNINIAGSPARSSASARRPSSIPWRCAARRTGWSTS